MAVNGKNVVITGASIGIGRESAFAFARKGARLALTYYRDKEEMKQAVDVCRNTGASEVFAVELNVADDASIHTAVETIITRFGTIDILINNAGTVAYKPFCEQNFDEIMRQLRVNLEGLIKMTSACLPFVRETIINVGSDAGLSGQSNLAVYCASKFGVRGFTQSLAQELPHMRIFTLNPGITRTRMSKFQGDPPRKVATAVASIADNPLLYPSGADINVRKFSES